MAKSRVLIIDESELFRDFLKTRLQRAGLEVETAINSLDGIVKMRNDPPDLVIMDYHLTRKTCKEVLEEKAADPNTQAIPLILTAQKIDKSKLLELVPYNIRKVFMKPVKMDAFYQVLTELIGIRFEIDKTPCLIEAHVNDNIIFVEIAKGLNRDKVDLLRFKIRELLNLYAIQRPKLLVMLADMELSFIDGSNLEILLNTIIEASRAKLKNIKILTREAFVNEFVNGRNEYKDIEVVTKLELALDGLLTEAAMQADDPEDKAAFFIDKVLSSQGHASGKESIEMRFETEKAKTQITINTARQIGEGLSIAVVDDDFVIQELLKTTFDAIEARVNTYSNGREFMTAVRSKVFDLVFLDLRMPELDGFGVLSELKAQDIEVPVIVLSAVTQRESIIRAFKSGVRSYLVKPLKPEQILKKTLEILKANF
ncbi:response regulator [Spirochaetota bacterium]